MHAFQSQALANARPDSVRGLQFPTRASYFPSPLDWRDEVLYFLLPDRFSDGQEEGRPPLDRANRAAFRPPTGNHGQWWWQDWYNSGGRWQGGTLKGVESKLEYVARLGATAIWVGPILKQRVLGDTFHGYAIQDFLEVDPRFGTRQDLVDLVDAAHSFQLDGQPRPLRVILDVVINHTGNNWYYDYSKGNSGEEPPYTGVPYDFGSWRDANDAPKAAPFEPDEAVWPAELQDPERYHRMGLGNYDAGGSEDANAQYRLMDIETLRDLRTDDDAVLTDLIGAYKYWIALADLDGFRIDTLKHVAIEDARNFCGAIKEYARSLGKRDFFLVGEVGGGESLEDVYLDKLQANLDAALSIGQRRLQLDGVAKGREDPNDYFGWFEGWDDRMGTHAEAGGSHVSVLDDHDHASGGGKVRFAAEPAGPLQGCAGTAIQLFGLGVPCVYYGTEQAFAGPEASVRDYLPNWSGDGSDRYLREAMFGPRNPRQEGSGSLPGPNGGNDTALPGFGPFGTCGAHCFDETHPLYRRIARMCLARARYQGLRYGRQYPRPFMLPSTGFALQGAGQIAAWSRVMDDEEFLIVVNANGDQARGGDVLVDSRLSAAGMTIVCSTVEEADAPPAGLLEGAVLPTMTSTDGTAYVEIRDLPPSECLVLANRP